MKRFLQLTFAAASLMSAMAVQAQESIEPRVLTVFDAVTFYDGYNGTVFDADLGDGVIRHANHLYAVRLTDEQLDWMGEDLRMCVEIGALCDNYDRIGNINLAFVPKGVESYVPEEVERIELARFITPFMNKNNDPKSVPYEFSDDATALIFRDSSLRAEYDYYLEFELFGVPYAANQQIVGCANRNDVFTGTFRFESTGEAAPQVDNHVLVPIVIKKPESKGHNLNNYSEAGTDTIGTCTKTYRFEMPKDVQDARITLITSNHGANAGGEEYVRRKHLIYVDGELELVYTPGGVSCEPYRKYNTQPNGIYGYRPQSDSSWASWNNWCPGAAIPIREVNLSGLSAGEHTVMIRVPDAEFADQQGDFPVSMYVQGLTEGNLPAGVFSMFSEADVKLRISDNILYVDGSDSVAELEIYDAAGRLCYGTLRSAEGVSLTGFVNGVYIAVATTADGRVTFRKFSR